MGFVIGIVILLLAQHGIGPTNSGSYGNTPAAAVESAVSELMSADESICRTVEFSPGAFYVDVSTETDCGGGRRFIVADRDGECRAKPDNWWLKSKFSDPVKQVRVVAHVDLALARATVDRVVRSLAPGELVSMVGPSRGRGPGAGKYALEPLENRITVRTKYVYSMSGRVFDFYASRDSLGLVSEGSWSF